MLLNEWHGIRPGSYIRNIDKHSVTTVLRKYMTEKSIRNVQLAKGLSVIPETFLSHGTQMAYPFLSLQSFLCGLFIVS